MVKRDTRSLDSGSYSDKHLYPSSNVPGDTPFMSGHFGTWLRKPGSSRGHQGVLVRKWEGLRFLGFIGFGVWGVGSKV